ncbi:hypothetical protein DFR59_10520 [Falsibacillus pallidus]|uniref:Uncharacterized protein n=1 Tax=Falsibacillus pallidus TaxID=493781 RepID=A0A370GES6_9BACI|nr:hypothetical protein DFR59_10520 [Falsibacillus pallidus]
MILFFFCLKWSKSSVKHSVKQENSGGACHQKWYFIDTGGGIMFLFNHVNYRRKVHVF